MSAYRERNSASSADAKCWRQASPPEIYRYPASMSSSMSIIYMPGWDWALEFWGVTSLNVTCFHAFSFLIICYQVSKVWMSALGKLWCGQWKYFCAFMKLSENRHDAFLLSLELIIFKQCSACLVLTCMTAPPCLLPSQLFLCYF